jgi:hypothetical protein
VSALRKKLSITGVAPAGRPCGRRRRYGASCSTLWWSLSARSQRAAHKNRLTKMNRNTQIEKVQPRTVAIELIEAMYDLHASAPAWLTSANH